MAFNLETGPGPTNSLRVPPALEQRFESIIEGPEAEHEMRVEGLCRAHPEHAPVLWRWLAIARRLSAPPSQGRAPAFELGHPDNIGPYRILARLAQGGMGTVYRAQHHETGRIVALKVIRSEFLDCEVARERFRREIQAVSRLEHPHICTVYDVGQDRGVPYMALQLVDGVDLGRRIATARESSADTTHSAAPAGLVNPIAREATDGVARTGILAIVRLFEKVARAVHAAHEQGLVHRDIKPGNIMVTDGGEPVVLDFGLARDEDPAGSTLSLAGDLLGTIEYAAPEQVTGGTVDRRSDVYSIGVSLYEALSLELPTGHGSRAEMLTRILHEDPTRLRKLNRAVPRDLEVVVQKAIDKDPAHRYASCFGLAEDLRRVSAFEPILARPSGPVLRLRRWVRRNPVAALLLLTFAIGIGVSSWQFLRAEGALDQFNMLAHHVKLRKARVARRELHPAWPAKAEDMRRWLRETADPLVSALPDLVSTLAELRAKALPWTEADRRADQRKHPDAARLEQKQKELTEHRIELLKLQGDDRLSGLKRDWVREEIACIETQIPVWTAAAKSRLTYRFPQPSQQFLHDALVELVIDLRRFAGSTTGARAAVRRDLAWAETVRELSFAAHQHRWRTAIAAIAQSASYREVRLTPQIGLVPIGPDPKSGLWEFMHLRSSRPGSPIPSRDPDTGALRFTADTGIVFVLLPGGTFKMGSQRDHPQQPNYDELMLVDQGPVHEVTLAPFFVSKYEMTQGQWLRLSGGDRPSNFHPKNLRDLSLKQAFTLEHPVEQVSWHACDELLRQSGLELPTEAQWEYAARAGTTWAWWTGPDAKLLQGAANVADLTAKQHGVAWEGICESIEDGYVVNCPVDTMRPNAFGLHHVIGNVWEWCRDSWGSYGFPVRAGDGLRDAVPHRQRVYRGGSCRDGVMGLARVAFRAARPSDGSGWHVGVRPARRIHDDSR